MEKFLKTNRETLISRKKLSTKTASKLYSVLINCCGASPRKIEKEAFIYHFAVCPNAEAEYVFQNSSGEYWRFISAEHQPVKVLLCKDNKTANDQAAESRACMVLMGIEKRSDVEYKSPDGFEFKRK